MNICKIPLEGEFGENKPYVEVYQTEKMPGETGRLPAVLICPGGGYTHLSPREAEPVALAFAAQGYQTFVLHYSLLPKRYPKPLIDAAKAMRLIRGDHSRWGVDPKKVAMCGFSAGGHLTAVTSTLAQSPILKEVGFTEEEVRPDATVLCYGVSSVLDMTEGDAREYIRRWLEEGADQEELCKTMLLYENVTEKNPPTFLWHTAEDRTVPVEHSLAMARALSANHVPFEMHIFPEGKHGLSLATERTCNGDPQMIRPEVARWFSLCCDWLKRTWEKRGNENE